MGDDSFDEDLFKTRLESLKDTQEGIQQMSSWCLRNRTHHKKIVSCWLNVLKRVRVEHRLVLFYLANDVIQYSKRKRYEYVESWATALQRATTMVRDEKVKDKILRIFKIWEQREIYSEEYLSDLSGLLNINPPKKSQLPTDPDDFQNGTLISNIRECVDLSNATDRSFKKLPKAPLCDIDNMKQQLKDKSHSEDVEKEIERYIAYIEAFNKNIHSEIRSRKHVLSSLDKAMKFYASQRVEVKVVVSAYKNFGSRIKLVKKKLDEITPNLPSPIPSPDINAPSPERDADLQLPEEQSPISMSMFKNNMNGFSSYLDGNLPFDINDFKPDDNTKTSSQQPIEVIGSRSDDESYGGSDYYKDDRLDIYSAAGSNSGNNNAIPGLNPLPVPPVQSGYTSLARSAQQYSALLPPQANAGIFGSSNSYGPPALYGGDGSYHGNVAVDANSYNAGGGGGIPPLMPPPPMPSSALAVGDVNGGSGGGLMVGAKGNASNDDFNSTWNMNMSWTSLNSTTASYDPSHDISLIDTPVSPPHYDREPLSSSGTSLDYSDHGHGAEDVDHRQFIVDTKLPPLSKEKTRQLDIDHRNLISLTGSPSGNDSDKKSPWSSSSEKAFSMNTTGDVDYRLPSVDNKPPKPPGTMDPPGISNHTKKSHSPQKYSGGSSADNEDDSTTTTSTARYDDMVVDMDMSDEDLDEMFRESNKQHGDVEHPHALATNDDEAKLGMEAGLGGDESADSSLGRPALLDTPGEYLPSNIWDNTAMSSGGTFDMQQQQQQPWNQMSPMPWNGAANGGGGGGGIPPPPRPPFPMPFQYPNDAATPPMGVPGGSGGGGNGEYPPGGSPIGFNGRGRGGGGNRNWANSPQGSVSGGNHFRNFPRTGRGGVGGNGGGGNNNIVNSTPIGAPYFSRGGRSGGVGGGRGNFRGKFRGNAWI